MMNDCFKIKEFINDFCLDIFLINKFSYLSSQDVIDIKICTRK